MDGTVSLLRRAEAAIPSGRGVSALFAMLRPDDDPQDWRSTLNNDGAPYQIAVTDANTYASVRLIVDPFRLDRDEADRVGRNLAAFDRIADRCSSAAAARCRRFMAALAPSFEEGCTRRSGDIWLAALPGAAGVGIYVTARGRAPQIQCARLIAAAGLDHHHAAIAAIHAYGAVEAYSIQGSSRDDLAINIYWKPRGGTQLPPAIDFEPPALSPGPPPTALARAPLGAMTLCSTFAVLGSGRGSKLDLCNHCLGLDLAASLEILRRFCDLSPAFARGAGDMLAGEDAEIAFLGVRVRPSGNRAYLYLKPAASACQGVPHLAEGATCR
jgi:hypothetical protein